MNINIKPTIFFFYIISLPIPLFFYLNGTVFNTIKHGSYPVLPLSFFLSCLVFFMYLKIPIKSVFFQLILVITFCSSILFFIQFLTIQNPNPTFLILYLAPMLAGFCNGYQIAKKISMATLITCCAYSASIFSLCHITYSLLSLGLVEAVISRLSPDLFGLFAIYQYHTYIPLIIASTFYLLFAKLFIYPESTKKIDCFCLVILFLETCLLSAREAIVVLLFSCFLFGLLSTYKRKKKVIFNLFLFFIVIASAYLFFIKQHLQPQDIAAISRFQTISNDNLSPGGRVEQWIQGKSAFTTYNPLLGEGFSMAYPKTSPHNQYLDFLLKGGLITTCLFIILFSMLVYTCIKYHHRSKQLVILTPLLFTWLIVSFMINTPLRAPISGVFIWFFIGTTNYYSLSAKHSKPCHRLPDITS